MELNQTQPPKPNSHMPMAIISTVLSVFTCMVPSLIFGIVSIVYASKVNSKYDMQDYEASIRASKNAKTWWIVSIVSLVVLTIASVVFFYTFLGDEFMEAFNAEMEKNNY